MFWDYILADLKSVQRLRTEGPNCCQTLRQAGERLQNHTWSMQEYDRPWSPSIQFAKEPANEVEIQECRTSSFQSSALLGNQRLTSKMRHWVQSRRDSVHRQREWTVESWVRWWSFEKRRWPKDWWRSWVGQTDPWSCECHKTISAVAWESQQTMLVIVLERCHVYDHKCSLVSMLYGDDESWNILLKRLTNVRTHSLQPAKNNPRLYRSRPSHSQVGKIHVHQRLVGENTRTADEILPNHLQREGSPVACQNLGTRVKEIMPTASEKNHDAQRSRRLFPWK